MTIDDFLKLQQTIKKIKEYEKEVEEYDELKKNKDKKKIKEFYKKIDNSNIRSLLFEKQDFFKDIATDIEYIEDELYDLYRDYFEET
jgi:arsenate reductase-like glutaredoxin family protein